MTKEQYERWSAPFRKRKGGRAVLRAIDKGITRAVFVSYPLLLGLLFLRRRFTELFFCVCVPGASFLGLSFFRKAFSAPRPYESLGIEPLIEKETVGKSFPSRHVFSVFVIGMTFFWICRPIGAAVGVLGLLLAYVRVAGGVHFPKDVAAGAALGILCGSLYFWI